MPVSPMPRESEPSPAVTKRDTLEPKLFSTLESNDLSQITSRL
jgi:hypothetical protein